jgi:hypothetical protein
MRYGLKRKPARKDRFFYACSLEYIDQNKKTMKHIRLFESWLKESSTGVKIDTDVNVDGDWKKDEELLSLVWNFILDPEGDSLWFQTEECKKIIELSKKYPKLRAESIKYVRQKGGILYRGIKGGGEEDPLFDRKGNYEVGRYKPIDSFTVDKKIAEEFSDHEYIIEIPLSAIEQNIVFSVDVLLNGVYIPDKHSSYIEDDLTGDRLKSLPSQQEIFIKGPLVIEKKYVKETNPDNNFVVKEIKKFVRKTYKTAFIDNKVSGPGNLIVHIGDIFVRILPYFPNELDIVKGKYVGREKSNSKRWPQTWVEKEVHLERKGESTEKWIQMIKDAITQFIV